MERLPKTPLPVSVAATSTVSGTLLVDTPAGVVTVTSRPPVAVVLDREQVAVSWVADSTAMPLQVTPIPETVTAVPLLRLLPMIETLTLFANNSPPPPPPPPPLLH